VDEKTLNFLLYVYSTHKKLHSEVGLDGHVYSRPAHGKATLTAVTDVIRVCLMVHNRLLFLHSSQCESFALL